MNILLAFKAEPDSGMLAEKDWLAATQDTCGPDTALLRSSPGTDEQAAAALLLAERRAGCEMVLTALNIGDERSLHWLRYFSALGFDKTVLLENGADLRFAPAFIAGQIADWHYRHGADLIITGCQSSEGQNGQTPFLLAEMLGWPCFSQVTRFALEAPFISVDQRMESGLRRCRVRLPAVIAVRQCGEVALPVPGMRQRLAAAKAEIIRQPVDIVVPQGRNCLALTRPEQRRRAKIIDGATAQEKARILWRDYLRQRCAP
ncbi:electron transfer flavoprotein subunit beta/FixA family protein [Citrobacter sp. 50677481]|uniref:electron transfer flavoprotein subunit beta/FixA family protein n=1 Tax=Citrobacter sp. 50677481 TaxID=1736699 RepID=UPI000741A6BF|nr:electron transfer flavoprotein subunit beta/FixA family protein [Citrobacter sp. 50677481]KSY32145.1 electron transfer flavoprotein [Citrobacter sp. 50677481]HCQ7755191.1 electron transfer flavoprotein subunit beta/FixA family protein [Citrobacter sedlakii]